MKWVSGTHLPVFALSSPHWDYKHIFLMQVLGFEPRSSGNKDFTNQAISPSQRCFSINSKLASKKKEKWKQQCRGPGWEEIYWAEVQTGAEKTPMIRTMSLLSRQYWTTQMEHCQRRRFLWAFGIRPEFSIGLHRPCPGGRSVVSSPFCWWNWYHMAHLTAPESNHRPLQWPQHWGKWGDYH